MKKAGPSPMTPTPSHPADSIYPEPRSERVRALKRELAAGLGLDPSPDGHRLDDLILAHLKRARRRITPTPRKVTAAPRFWDSALAQAHREKVEALVGLIEKGEDLDPYLSARAHAPGEHPRDRQHDGDFALAAYGVHHLHFDAIDPSRPRAKDGPDVLLFVAFERDAARLIMVGDHKSFFDGRVEEEASRARAAEGYVIKGILGPARSMDAKARTRLAAAGINTVAEIDGSFVFSSSMNAANGSFVTTRTADRLYLTIFEHDLMLDDPARMRQLLGPGAPAAPRFAWHFERARLVLVEEVTGTRLPFPE